MTGFEPVNLFLTKEALYRLSYMGNVSPQIKSKTKLNKSEFKKKGIGAGDEARTRDIQLGRLMLYQLSYSRSKKDGGKPPSILKHTFNAVCDLFLEN